MSFPRDFSPAMTVCTLLMLIAYATEVSDSMGAGSSVLGQADSGCQFLELQRGDGWWCCANRTLSVHQDMIVGRRHGVTDKCSVFLSNRTTLVPTSTVAMGEIDLFCSLIISITVVLIAFAICAVPFVTCVCWCRHRAARRQLQLSAPVFANEDGESGEYDYHQMASETLVHQL